MANTTTSGNETPFGITQIRAYIPVILDLNKLNYEVWRELFETHCLSFSVLGHIDGSSTPTPMTEKKWKERDGLVKMWIYGTITDSLLDTVIKAGCTARDLWLSLENLFRDNKEARALQFDNELRTITIRGLSVQEYCQKMKSLSDLLTNVDSPISDRVLVMHLLNGLTEEYDYILNVIKHKSPFPSFTEARSMLLMEESRLSKHSKSSLSHTHHHSSPNFLSTVSDRLERSPQQHLNNNNRSYKYINNWGQNLGSIRGHYNNDNNWGFNPPPLIYGPPQWPYSYLHGGPQLLHNQTYPTQQPTFYMPASHKASPTSTLGQYNPRPHGDAHLTYVAASMADQFMLSHVPQTVSSMSLLDPTDGAWYIGTKATNNTTPQQDTHLRSVSDSGIIPLVLVGNGSSAHVTHLDHGSLHQDPTTLT